jgi:hypothetical protein
VRGKLYVSVCSIQESSIEYKSHWHEKKKINNSSVYYTNKIEYRQLNSSIKNKIEEKNLLLRT